MAFRWRNPQNAIGAFEDLERAVDRHLAKHWARDTSVAVVVGVFSANRSIIRGYGSLQAAERRAPDGATIFQIASVSKLLTACLLQALCDDGVVTLDARLDELIGQQWPLAAHVKRVTLRQLATHTSGFPSIPAPLEAEMKDRAAGGDWAADPYSYLGSESILGYLATADDMGTPGRFSYSNFGTGLLGHVLECVTGQPFEALVINQVLDHADMRDTRIELTASMAARLAPGHDEQGQPAGLWHFKSLAGAGGFASSAQDLLKFLQASLTPGTKAAAAFAKMRLPQAGGRTGLGWMQPDMIDRLAGNGSIVWHNGMVGGYASYVSIDDVTRTGVVVLVNKAVDVTLLGFTLARLVRRHAGSSHPRA